nr:hypothetical protein BHI3_03320 [Bacteriovorax sp. HI3]
MKYVMKLPDHFVKEQLQNYFSGKEYTFSIAGESLEVFPLQRNDEDFLKQLASFKTDLFDVSLKINQLWLNSRKLTPKKVEHKECNDVVKCSINDMVRFSTDPRLLKEYEIVFNDLKNKRMFGDLMISNWTNWVFLAQKNVDTSFQTVILRPNYTLYKKTLLAFWVSVTLSILIMLVRLRREL